VKVGSEVFRRNRTLDSLSPLLSPSRKVG
jgi:hypothetical protein